MFHVEHLKSMPVLHSVLCGDWVQRYGENVKKGVRGNVPRGTFPLMFLRMKKQKCSMWNIFAFQKYRKERNLRKIQ